MYLYRSFTHLRTTHSYHLVDSSSWPIVGAFSAFMLTTGLVCYMQRFVGGWSLFFTGLKRCGIQKFKNISLTNRFGITTRVYISKHSKKIYRFIEHIGLFSSAWSVYPEGFGKYQLFSWFANQTSDIAIFIKACLIADIFLLSTAVIGFFYLFIVLQKDKFFVGKVLPFYKNLNFRQKMLFGSFTFFIAIPNKFWVNNKINVLWTFILSFIIYIIGLVFPILFFCYVVYLIICFQSLIFAISYEKFDLFKRFINKIIFGASEEPFAKEYFAWFWGNMYRKAAEKAAGVAAAAAMAEAQRQHENKQKEAYADKHTDKGEETKQGFDTPDDRARFHGERRQEWVEENGTVTWAIEKTKEYYSGKGSGKPSSASLENFNLIPDTGSLEINNLMSLALKKITKWCCGFF